MLRHRFHRTVLLALVVLASRAMSQVPDGWFIASSFRLTGTPGPSGIYLVPPLGGAWQPVTGLPAVVAGLANPAANDEGTDFILRRPSDGALITNGWSVPGVPMPLYVLRLSGAVVVSGATAPYDLGLILPQSTLGTPQAALLPDERILVVRDNVGVAGISFVRVDPALGPPGTAGSVTPIAVSPQPAGRVNAMAVDPTGSVVAIGMLLSSTNTSAIYTMPLGPVLNPVFLATMTGAVRNLQFDGSGRIVACGGLGAETLVAIDVATGVKTPIAGAPPLINAFAVERVSGQYIVARFDNTLSPVGYRITRVPANGGPSTPVSTYPPGGAGELSGLDIDPDPETFGAATASASFGSTWLLAPNPGGLPAVGNASFSLSVVSNPGGNPGLLAISAAPLSPALPAAGMLLHADLAQLLFLGPLSGTPVETLALPLPPDPQLSGIAVYLQAAHASGNQIVDATEGLKVTIL